MSEQDSGKRSAAKAAVSHVKDGMIIGLGTGSTVEFFLYELAERVKKGLKVCGIPTSVATEKRAISLGIRLCEDQNRRIDIDFDGADEVDAKGNLIKGGGGALTREKIVAYNSEKVFVLVDDSKLSKGNLGRHSLPVEILRFMHIITMKSLEPFADSCSLRRDFTTDNGNYIVDLEIADIADPAGLEASIKAMPGVVEVGLFVGLTTKVIVGSETGSYDIDFKK